MIVALAIFVGIVMPLYAVYQAWQAGRGGRLAWILRIVAAASFMGFLTLVARWDFLSVYLLWLWWLLVAVLGLLGLWQVAGRNWIEGEKRSQLWSTALEPVIGLGLLGYAAWGLPHPAAVDLAFPLTGGSFVVGQGGGSAVLNYHNVNQTQRFATDILALDALGRRADGFEPAELQRYRIYGMQVVAPCEGEVTAATDGLPDNAIGETNRDAPAGNHVVIACEGIEVLLAHIQPGTVAPAIGDRIAAGQPVGLVGNSGNSSEPHLHIHAVRAGTGGVMQGDPVALTFGGVFPVRGTIIRN